MGSINSGTLPTNFLDSVSLGMRLPQPEPRYMFAKMATAAGLMADALAANVDSAASFLKMQGGGQEVPMVLDELARFVDAYPMGVNFVRGFGLGAGDTIKLRRQVFAGGGYTLADREVKPDVATSTTGQLIKQEEVPIVLKEYEGPFADGGTVPAPFIIREFDAKYKANKDDVVSLTKLHLLRDRIKWLDTVIRDLFRATTSITYADDVANVLSFTAGAGHFISLDAIIKARKAVSDREWSPFQNGRYVCLVPTAFNVQMIGDPDYRALSAQHGGGRNQLFGYIASIQDVDIFECSTLKQYAAGVTVPTDGQVVPTSAVVEEALLFGPGVVGMGQAKGPTAYDSDDTNYGKEAKVIWRAIEAFQTLDIRGCQRILFQSA